MYIDFYNLKEKPFNLTPSSRFLYLGEIHKEALALLTYGVVERKGFTLMTGEVGSGKTTMIHALLANLDKNAIYVHLSNPLLSSEDFIEYLSYSVFKKKVNFKSKTTFLVEFESFLKKCFQHQKNFILIIDEAHKLSFDLLEEIRLLSNLETADEKLINIFLVGQPELNEKLNQPKCRALLQRISTRYHIQPLDVQSTNEYILNRLKLAGASQGTKIFSNSVIKSIHRYSKGYPRMINILCDNALLLGYSRGIKKITPAMIDECSKDLQIEYSLPETNLPEKTHDKQSKINVFLPAHYWKWSTLALFIAMLISITWVILSNRFQQMPFYLSGSDKASAEQISAKRHLVKNEIENRMSEVSKLSDDKTVDNPPGLSYEMIDEQNTQLLSNGNLQFKDDSAIENEFFKERIVTVREGETLVDLAINEYGTSNGRIIDILRTRNPELIDINFISVGQKIVFPPIFEPRREYCFTVHVASFKPFEKARNLFSDLISRGYQAYIIPVYTPQNGKTFRITIGSFLSAQKAEEFGKKILNDKITKYAKVIQLDMK